MNPRVLGEVEAVWRPEFSASVCLPTRVCRTFRRGFRFSGSPAALTRAVCARRDSCICIGGKPMFNHEIRIRIAGEGLAFVYSIWRAGELISTAEVAAAGDPVQETLESEIAPGYYGGSEVMD